MAVVSILVTARNAAAAAFTAAVGQTNRLDRALRNVSSDQLRAAGRAVSDLSTQSADAQREVARLDRLVRFMGQGASNQLRQRLADARREADRLSRSLNDADRNARQLQRRFNRVAAISRATGGIASGVLGAVSGVAKFGGAGLAAIPIVQTLLGAVGSLLGLLLLVPAAVAPAVAAVAVLKVGFRGVGDALGAGLSGDTEKYRESLKKLTADARHTVETIVKLSSAWRNKLAPAIQVALFKNTAVEIDKLNSVYLPKLATWLPRIAKGANAAFLELGAFLRQEGTQNQIEGILRNITVTLDNLFKAATPVTQILLDLVEVGSGKVSSGSEGFLGWIRDLADKVRELKESGKLSEWIDDAKENLGKLVEIAKNVGETLVNMFRGGKDEGDGLLDTIDKVTEKMARFSGDKEGQQSINTFLTLIATIVEVLLWLDKFFNSARAVSGAWEKFGGVFKGMWNLAVESVRVAVTAILGMLGMILSGAAFAFGWIPGIGPKLKQAEKEFFGFVGNVNAALNRIKTDINVNVNVRYRQIGRAVPIYSDFSSGIGGRASGGIATGMKWVGERGRELVDFGAAGGRVLSHGDSERVAAQSSSRPTVIGVQLAAAPGGDRATGDFVMSLIERGLVRLTVTNGKVMV